MNLSVIRIENRIVTCEILDGDSATLIDIAHRWFTNDIQVGDTIEVDVQSCNTITAEERYQTYINHKS